MVSREIHNGDGGFSTAYNPVLARARWTYAENGSQRCWANTGAISYCGGCYTSSYFSDRKRRRSTQYRCLAMPCGGVWISTECDTCCLMNREPPNTKIRGLIFLYAWDGF